MDKQSYKEEMSKLISENSELKEKVKELETKLYFKDRNMMLELTMENSELKDIIEELGGNDKISGLNKTNVESIRTDEWRVSQFNRNRAPEDQVSTIDEMEEKVKQLFDKKYIYESPDAGKTITSRKFGDYDNKETLNN